MNQHFSMCACRNSSRCIAGLDTGFTGVDGSRRELLAAAAALLVAAQAPRPARADEPGPPAVALQGKPATGEAANITAAPAADGEAAVSALLIPLLMEAHTVEVALVA